MRKAQLKKYAKLLVKIGLNVKKGQTVFIGADLQSSTLLPTPTNIMFLFIPA